MATKIQLAEQSQRILLGGNVSDDREVKLAELILYVGQCFGALVRANYFENKVEGEDLIDGDSIFEFEDQAVLVDTKKGILYAEMPEATIALPRDMGVYHVSCMKSQDAPFIPVTPSFSSLYKGLGAAKLGGESGYFINHGRVYLPGTKEGDVEKLLIKLVAPLGQLEDDEDLFIPLEMQHEIVRKTVEMYRQQEEKIKDVISDNLN